MNLAQLIDAIPVVQSTADRGTRFQTPATDQRVYNKGTLAIERWDGAAWQRELTQRTWSGDRGDASVVLTAGVDATEQWFNTPLTAARTVTLSATGARAGDRFRTTRSAAATGASTLTVGTKALAVGQWVEHVFDGAAWQEVAFGSL